MCPLISAMQCTFYWEIWMSVVVAVHNAGYALQGMTCTWLFKSTSYIDSKIFFIFGGWGEEDLFVGLSLLPTLPTWTDRSLLQTNVQQTFGEGAWCAALVRSFVHTDYAWSVSSNWKNSISVFQPTSPMWDTCYKLHCMWMMLKKNMLAKIIHVFVQTLQRMTLFFP